MGLAALAPWLVLLAYAGLVLALAPRRVEPGAFFTGTTSSGEPPALWLLIASAAISWLFAKSIANAASLASAFGVWGALGYAAYYLSFATAAAAIYFIRRRGFPSLAGFLVSRYGRTAARLFLAAVAIRLFNEVWSNTKVAALYFGAEGSGGYWTAVLAFTAFTLFYSLRGGIRSSLVTDGVQMLMAAALLVAILASFGPELAHRGLPTMGPGTRAAGLTFAGLALVQVLSYPFHDPVLTDRAFLNPPREMVKGFLVAGAVAGAFILLFSTVGLYARASGLEGDPVVVVPAAAGLPMLLVFNAIMLTSAGSTLDSTFASTAKLTARDWRDEAGAPTARQARRGRVAIAAMAVLGNLPLLGIYLGDRVGPAIIAATTISGTMVMGLAPIFLLWWVPGAGRLSFQLAFWPGLAIGVVRVLEGALATEILPRALALGSGGYAIDLGANVWGLLLCTAGFLLGAAIGRSSEPPPAPGGSRLGSPPGG